MFASTFFEQPKSYVRTINQDLRSEKMAVIVQEIVGAHCGERFYPAISGVARSYSYYPVSGADPGDGVVNLALGLGKEIVDGGITWTYCPARPDAPPPYAGLSDLVRNTQTEFWAVNMGPPPPHDPVRETEYLIREDLESAEYDGCLDNLVSTCDTYSERLRPGICGDGPRVLDFAPLLSYGSLNLNELILRLLELSREALGAEVELEFAIAIDVLKKRRARFGFLQARPMMVSHDRVDIDSDEFVSESVLIASSRALGNGVREDLCDIVYLVPDRFDAGHTVEIAEQLATINRELVDSGRHYVLVGFGRWGSSDPWLGVPVDWGQIAGARVIVEATLPDMTPDLSQGSHFFQNMTSFRVLYLSVRHSDTPGIDWDWLSAQPAVSETRYIRHIRLSSPLRIRVDGRSTRGIVEHA